MGYYVSNSAYSWIIPNGLSIVNFTTAYLLAPNFDTTPCSLASHHIVQDCESPILSTLPVYKYPHALWVKSHIRKVETAMEIKVNLGDHNRKELAAAVGEIVGAEIVYKGPPSYAYEVGDMLIDRSGALICGNEMSIEVIRRLLDGLRECGFSAEKPIEMAEVNPVEAEPEVPAAVEIPVLPDKLIIQLPLAEFDDVSLDNLHKLIASKATLIKKAIGVDDLTVENTDEVVSFHWFSAELSGEEVKAYTHFIAALCDMAKRQARVLATEKPIENEKYAFRCFLLRLGMIGDEYTETRRILLRNLTGNGSTKSGESKRGLATTPVPPTHATPAATAANEIAPPAPPKPRFSWRNWFNGLKMMGY
jgi:hypothetical protein